MTCTRTSSVQWRARLLEGAADVFGEEPAAVKPPVDVTVLHAKIGELTLANDFFGRCAREGRSVAERKTMIDREHSLPLIVQARQLGISRGSIYYLPRPVSDSDLAIMRRIDELDLLYPFAGSRMLRDLLRQEGVEAGRLHVATLMKRMRIEAIYCRPNTSKPATGHKVYPYLLRKLAVTRPNQVWTTYIAVARGFVYLVAIVDWFTRRVLAWRVSISLDAGFCIEALEKRWTATASRQSSTHKHGVHCRSPPRADRHPMDGKGCWRDNVFVERLWRSVKYEEVYLNAYVSVPESRTAIGRYIGFYNAVRPHSALGGRTPDQIYFAQPLLAAA